MNRACECNVDYDEDIDRWVAICEVCSWACSGPEAIVSQRADDHENECQS